MVPTGNSGAKLPAKSLAPRATMGCGPSAKNSTGLERYTKLKSGLSTFPRNCCSNTSRGSGATKTGPRRIRSSKIKATLTRLLAEAWLGSIALGGTKPGGWVSRTTRVAKVGDV